MFIMPGLAGGLSLTKLWTAANLPSQPAQWLNDESAMTTVSSAVSQWNDKTSNARHMFQSDSARRPAVNSSGLNGRRTVSFDGSNDYLYNQNTEGRNLAQQVSAIWNIMVFRRLSVDGSAIERCLFGIPLGGGFGSSRFSTLAGSSAAANKPSCWIRRVDGDSLGQLTATNTTGTSWMIAFWLMDYSMGDAFIEINGTANVQNLSLTSSGNTSNTLSDGGIALGGYQNVSSSNAVQYPTDVEIAEHIVGTNSLPSVGDRQRLAGSLAYKWGLQSVLDSGHPYKTNPPLA